LSAKTFTRKELYDLVWSKPLIQLAKEYGISDNGLRKICKRMEIPLPKGGHWMKLKFGKKVEIKKLSENYNGKSEVTLSERINSENFGKETPLTILTKEIKANKDLITVVSERLNSKNEFIAKAKISLKKNKVGSWNSDKGKVNTNRGELNICVSRQNISRALRFTSTFIKLLEQRGHCIKQESEEKAPYAEVKGEKIEFYLNEKSKRIIVKGTHYDSYEFEPNGILSFKYGEWKTYELKDGKVTKIEDKLPQILARFELLADKIKVDRSEREEWHRQYEIERKKKEELQKLKDSELENLKILMNSSELLHKAQLIRDYIIKVEQKFSKQNRPLNDEVKSWVKWANDKADWFDPLTDKEIDLLEEVDKLTLKSTKYY